MKQKPVSLKKKSQKLQTFNKIKKKRKKMQITTTDLKEIKRIIIKYCEQFYTNMLDNLDKMDKFLGGKKKLSKEKKIFFSSPSGIQDLSSLIRDGTHASCIGSSES